MMSRRQQLLCLSRMAKFQSKQQRCHGVFPPSLFAAAKSSPSSMKKLCGCTTTTSSLHTMPSDYDFLEERNRWQNWLSCESDTSETLPIAGVIVPLSPSEWKTMISHLHSTTNGHEIANWLDDQEGVITFPPNDDDSTAAVRLVLEQHLNIKNVVDDGRILILVRLKQDDEQQSTEGMRSRSKGLKPLADRIKKWRRDEIYKIVFPVNSSIDMEEATLTFLLDCYSFERYKTKNKRGEQHKEKETKKQGGASVVFPQSSGVDSRRKETQALTSATYYVNDLISTPALDLTPEAIQRVAEQLVDKHPDYMQIETIVGVDLLSYNGSLPEGASGCGMIYAVGGAANQRPAHEPRLVHISYRPPAQSKSHVALVGKGVTFDTGGLNLKPGASMLHMKKDMGGAAHVLGLLSCLVEMDAPLGVNVWIPVVENVIGAASFRPGDVLTSITGQTTEVGNTDAEGRLILGDALALASALHPNLIIDFATLTGAARVAMGHEVVPFFSNNSNLARQLLEAAVCEHDPMWQLPLWHGYLERITKSSKLADLRNIPSDGGLGGAITAALYLQQFVGTTDEENGQEQIPWIHLDLYGMNATTGLGEAQGLRSIFRLLWNKYC